MLPAMQGSRVIAVLVAATTLALAAPAGAVTCRSWTRMDDAQRSATVERMIRSAVRSNSSQHYTGNHGAVERCLFNNAREIEYAFDDVCEDKRQGLQALNNTFNRYVWSCVR